MLDHHGRLANLPSNNNVADAQLHHVATAQLAVDCYIEHRSVASALHMLQMEADLPNLLRLERTLWANRATDIPSRSRRACMKYLVIVHLASPVLRNAALKEPGDWQMLESKLFIIQAEATVRKGLKPDTCASSAERSGRAQSRSPGEGLSRERGDGGENCKTTCSCLSDARLTRASAPAAQLQHDFQVVLLARQPVLDRT